ncbi:MAG: hypothetical protein R3D58_21365 [Saprospiraceae bacterium]|nr:hypothetical protein [Lewinellaceae bacterium]
MIVQQKYIRLNTALLGLFLLASMMLKTGHLLMLEHTHHHVPVCTDDHDKHATHLHDERFNPDACSICAFLFAIPELSASEKQFHYPHPFFDRTPVGNTSPFHGATLPVIYLRGPPALRRIAHC